MKKCRNIKTGQLFLYKTDGYYFDLYVDGRLYEIVNKKEFESYYEELF